MQGKFSLTKQRFPLMIDHCLFFWLEFLGWGQRFITCQSKNFNCNPILLIIGHLIHCFPGENALVFIECGLITEGREWVGIDQWRMDKFMMLTRRFLRQAFNFLSKDNWEKVNNMTEIFSSSVISNPTATLGFRLHFTDVYLEEVAKAGGEEFSGDIILGLIGK